MVTPSLLTGESVSAFGVFARHLNFTHAAEELHLSQPSLHAKINKLGKSLGVELYERRGRDLVLTAAGESLAGFAADTECAANQFFRRLRDQPPRLSVFAGRAMLRWVLDERISVAVKANVEVDVTEADREASLEALADGRADVIGIAADPPPAMLESLSVATVDQMLIVPRRHRLAKMRSVRLEEFVEETLILPPRGRPHRDRVERAFAEVSHSPRVVTEVDGWELIAHLASLGLGNAIVNGLVPAPKGMVAVPIADLPPIDYWLAWHSDRDHLARYLNTKGTG